MPLGKGSALNTIIHPLLQQSLPRVYPSFVTIQTAVETQGNDNSIDEDWEDAPGLEVLKGILAAASANEIRLASLTNVTITHVLDLQDYHPEIDQTFRVLVSRAIGETEQIFNIMGVKHDSQASSSRIELEEVSH